MNSTSTATRNDLLGIGWMLLAGLCFVIVNGTVRWLGTSLPSPEAAFIRFAFGLVFLLPVLVPVMRRGFTPRSWRLFALRGAVHSCAVAFWFYAMARITVAEVTAIGYLSPIIVTLGAALILGESLSWRRMTAIVVALCGALIVLRPGLRELTPGHLSQVVASMFFGCSYLIAKRLSAENPATVVVAMLSLSVTIGLAPLAMMVWVMPQLSQLLTLALTAAFATTGHYCMTRAFAIAPLTVTQPVTFLQLLWASLLGWFVFSEKVDLWVLLGGTLMISAICYITWREAGARRARPAVV
ncbi:DMT family transporter [Paracoccus sp. (in: a-proteobacteria)]|uniref:DMT family transporter n=1 Tax=Paracoccus sp. TaxID=267 RepID=UPI00289AAF93|nr:DMT family transporter [Paracoccus sp. (in: a-proteobacteria)]